MDELTRRVRQKLRIIGYAVSQLDNITDRIAESRFKFEYFRRNPKMGMREVEGEMVAVVSSSGLKQEIEQLKEERESYLPILLHYTNTEDEDSARQVYMDLFAAFNRLGKLREQDRLVSAGFTLNELELPFLEEEAGLSLTEALSRAETKLAEVDASVSLPEPSVIELLN